MGTSLEDMAIINDLHEYAAFEHGNRLGEISYFDVCAFHEDDDDVAEQCLLIERAKDPRRKQAPRLDEGSRGSSPLAIAHQCGAKRTP